MQECYLTFPFRGILNGSYDDSSSALLSIYPEVDWQLWRFGKVPRGYWQRQTFRRNFMDWMAEYLNFQREDEWYSITEKKIKKHGGTGLLYEFENSVLKSLEDAYPDFEWQPWRFGRASVGYWNDMKNQRKFMDWIADQLEFKDMNEWYSISEEKISEMGGKSLIDHHYEGSPSLAIISIYNDIPWNVHEFDKVPNGYWNDKKNHRTWMDFIAEKYKVDRNEDWYEVCEYEACEWIGRSPINTHYAGSHVIALIKIYSDSEWHPWRFQRTFHGYWNSMENRRKYFDWLEDLWNMNSKDEWYDVFESRVSTNHGNGLLWEYYSGSLSLAIMDVYPEYPWQPWKFQRSPRGFWDNDTNLKEILERIAEEINIRGGDDWYEISSRCISATIGRKLSRNYGNSPQRILNFLYPDTLWLPWKFQKVPRGYWNRKSNRKFFYEWIEDRLGIQRGEEWYEVKNQDIVELGGAGLLQYYGGSHVDALKDIHWNSHSSSWQPWRFDSIPRSNWNIPQNRRNFFDSMAEELGLNSQEDWYYVNRGDIIKGGGAYLISSSYDNVAINALKDIYSDSDWNLWRFDSLLGRNVLKLERNSTSKYLEWVEDMYNISRVDQWNGITMDRLTDCRYGKILSRDMGHSIIDLLRSKYPSLEWRSNGWNLNGKSRSQDLLFQLVRSIVPHSVEIEWEAKNPAWISDMGDSKSRFDIWIPYHNISMEYNGIQHYVEDIFVHHDFGMKEQRRRDVIRSKLSDICRIEVISIPFWWKIDYKSVRDILEEVWEKIFPYFDKLNDKTILVLHRSWTTKYSNKKSIARVPAVSKHVKI
jgi:hypothetical protein